jgi:regulation of enolase protein 1 (concanavalin A-like superfamily)
MSNQRRVVAWDAMTWTNEPASAEAVPDGGLVVRTRPDTDFWRETSYGFVHDSGHFLGMDLDGDAGIEVVFAGRFEHQFDHAGLMLRAAPDRWFKTGVERSDGVMYASAVVTAGRSDWSVARVPAEHQDGPFTFRVSRTGDAVTIRYGAGPSPVLDLLRVLPLAPGAAYRAGIFACAPTGPGLEVTFGPLVMTEPDGALHPD